MDDWLESTMALLSGVREIAEGKEGKLAGRVTEALTELEGLAASGDYDALILRLNENHPLVLEAFRKWKPRKPRTPEIELLIAENPELLGRKESGHYEVKPAVVRSYLEEIGCDLTRVDDDDIRRARRNAAKRSTPFLPLSDLHNNVLRGTPQKANS